MKKKFLAFFIGSLMVLFATSQTVFAQKTEVENTQEENEQENIQADDYGEELEGETVEKDTVDIMTNPNRWRPRKAALLSIIPGLGQIYNGNPWKIPVIYAGFAYFWHKIVTSEEEYKYWLAPYIAQNDFRPGTIPQSTLPSDSNIDSAKDYYRRERDYYIIIMSIWYALNIVEAAVDAHLSVYDVSDDLSVTFEPTVITDEVTAFSAVGVSFKLLIK